MKVGSFGVVFIFFLIMFIVVTGILALSNTEFMIGSDQSSNDTNWSEGLRTLTLANSSFAPLAGILGLGYFLHPISLPIVRSSANPDKTGRDLFYGYFFVFLSYILIGTLGYIGFMGINFTEYFINTPGGLIDQNCLKMFSYTDVSAFILRLAIFLLILSSYPLLHFLTSNILIKLLFGENAKRLTEVALGGSITLLGLLFALFYSNIGTIISYVGAVCGFVVIYLLPVLVHL